MDVERCKELHEVIEKGDVEVVRRLLRNEAAGQYFSYKETSALYKAFCCEQYEIASYLIHKGAKIDDSEVYDICRLHIDLTRVNFLLLDYNKKSEKSCIFRLISWSQSPQGLDGERLNAVMSLYEDLFKSKIIKQLMDVLETEYFDIVYDFESEDVNRIHRLYEVESEILGLTLSISKEIFIGAKHLLSGDPRKRHKVYGVVAEELCHLALTTLFENNAKPYREEHFKLSQEFKDIVLAVKCLIGRSCHVEPVIKDVFECYEHYQWECELIARVPHVIGIYGEEFGRGIFLESPELSRLLYFYERNVLPKCKVFTEPSLNTKPHRMMERLVKRNDFISFREKQIRPLKQEFPSFREYLEDDKGISVITTNCTKLCTLHVYHELKGEYGELMEKKCLFFTSKCYEVESDKILDALKAKVWEYFILVVDEKELNIQRVIAEYLIDFEEFKNEGIEIIIISGFQSLSHEFKIRTLNYAWDDLTDEYKYLHQLITYVFNGVKESIYVPKECFPKVFSEVDILRIISGNIIEVRDGAQLFSHCYIPEIYMEREFQVPTVDRKIFDDLPYDTCIFISGLRINEFQELMIKEYPVQWLREQDEKIQDNKQIFIVNDEKGMSFENFEGKNPRKNNIWLQYAENKLILRTPNSTGDVFKQYVKQVTLREEEILDFLEKCRVIIISDNAGYGKSTVLSSLIRGMKNKTNNSWLWRIDLNKFSTDIKDPHSLANIDPNSHEEDVLNYLLLMLGINSGLEKHLFRNLSRYGRCFIFFDGFDEIPSKYTNNAMKLLSTLNEKTHANMIITTRKHHQQELEQLLNTYSYQLVSFSAEDQVRYLQKLWKSKLKYPHGEGIQSPQRDKKAILDKVRKIIEDSKKEKLDQYYQDLILALENIELQKSLNSLRCEIDNLNFTKLAENILEKTSLDKRTLEFMGIPLHLHMIGMIHFNGNFNQEVQSDIYSLYSVFIEQKILIYVEEKQGLWHDGRVKDDILKMRRKDAYRIHMKLACELMDEGKIYLASEMDEEDLELCFALGIVFIECGAVNFLHKTFAEFFLAESLRKKMQKKIFMDVLSMDKYNVVRRFLSSALEKKNFENLTKAFFSDMDFLIDIMKKIIEMRPVSNLYESNLEMFNVFKMVKKLLENFEVTIESDLVNEFIEKVEFIVKEAEEYNYIGGCLTVCMLKNLLGRNLKVYLLIFFTFARYSENHDEVVDVLIECISVKTVHKCGSGLGEDEKAGLLELFSIKNSFGNDLLDHALCNERAEIFAYLLKLSRDVLGKERFITAIVQSDEYGKRIKEFIKNVDLNRIFSLFRALHSVFGNEMELLFDNDSKFCVVDRAVYLDYVDELRNSFQWVIILFHECFRSEEWKECLLCRNSDGDCLIHMLTWKLSTRTSLKNLSLVANILGDKHKMKQLLKSKNRYLWNVLHIAAYKRDMYLDELIRFCDAYFGKDEIKEMVLSADEDGNDVIHNVLLNDSSEALIKNLNLIKGILDDNGRFKEILSSKSNYFGYILHMSAENNLYHKDLLGFCDANFEKDAIKEMLLSAGEDGNNVIHLLVLINPPEILIKNLELIKGILGDQRSKELFKSKGNNFRNIFHMAAEMDLYLDDLLGFCVVFFEKAEIKEMLLSADADGDNVIHILVLINSPGILMKNLNLIKEFSGDDEWFKLFFKSKGNYYRNIFHIASANNMYLDHLLRFCDVSFEKDEIKEILLSSDIDGDNVIHVLILNDLPEVLNKNLELIKNSLGDGRFKELLKSKGNYLRNAFHFAAMNQNEINPSSLNSYFFKSEIADLLTEVDENGNTCLHFAAYSLKNILVWLEFANELLMFDRSRFIELILAVDVDGDTFLHCFEEMLDNDSVSLIFSVMKEKLSDEEYKELLGIRNKKGQTFLQIESKFKERMITFCKEILEKDLFEELL